MKIQYNLSSFLDKMAFIVLFRQKIYNMLNGNISFVETPRKFIVVKLIGNDEDLSLLVGGFETIHVVPQN